MTFQCYQLIILLSFFPENLLLAPAVTHTYDVMSNHAKYALKYGETDAKGKYSTNANMENSEVSWKHFYHVVLYF